MKRGYSIYRVKGADAERVSHQFAVIPIKPNSLDRLVKIMNTKEMNEKVDALHGLNDLELFVSGDVSFSPVAVFHACFLKEQDLRAAAQNVTTMVSSLQECIAHTPNLISGNSVWRSVGSSVLDARAHTSYCRLKTLPLQVKHAELLIKFLKGPETQSIIPSLHGLIGVEVIQTTDLLMMASVFDDAITANVADEIIENLLEPMYKQWWAASDMQATCFEGVLLWSSGNQSFSQVANFAHVLNLKPKPGAVDDIVSELEAGRKALTQQHTNGLVRLALVETSDSAELLAVSGWWGSHAARDAKPSITAAFANLAHHMAEKPSEDTAAVFWRWQGEAAQQKPGYMRLSTAAVNADLLSDWVQLLHLHCQDLAFVEGLIALETLLVVHDTATKVTFVEVYSCANSAVVASSAIHKLIASTAPEGLICGEVLEVQSGPVSFFYGVA